MKLTMKQIVTNKNAKNPHIAKLHAAGSTKIIRIIPISRYFEYLIFHQSKSITDHNTNQTAI